MLHLFASLALCAAVGDHAALAEHQPVRTSGSPPLVAGVPVAQVSVALGLYRAPDARTLRGVAITDVQGNGVRGQGSDAARVYIAGGARMLDWEDRGVEALSSPRLLVLAGQEGSIHIGQEVEYAVLEDGGETMRRVTDESVIEGLSCTLVPGVTESGGVMFERLNIALSTVVGRLDVTDADGTASAPLPAGKPLTLTTTYSLPVTLEQGERAIVFLAPNGDDGEAFAVVIEARTNAGD